MQPSEYAGHGFNEALEKGRASGRLKLTGAGVDFTIGGHSGRLPLRGLQIKLGGASDRLVFFSHPDYPDWSLYTSDRAILNDPALQGHPEVRRQVQRARRRRVANGTIFGAVAGLIIGLPLLIVLQMDWLTAQAAREIPPRWENELGQSVVGQYHTSHTFMDRQQTRQLLQPLVDPLLAAVKDSRYDYRFYIVDDPSLNAFALPGGHVVIHSELIAAADNAEELLGVLAHEIVHVERQHGVRNVLGSAGIYLLAATLFGDVEGLLATVAGAAPLLINQSYSRDFEREADKAGHALLLRADIAPSGLTTFFDKLIAREAEQLAGIDNEQVRDRVQDGMGLLSTHPASEERVAYLRELSAQVPARDFRDFSEPFAALQAGVKQFVSQQRSAGAGQHSIEE